MSSKPPFTSATTLATKATTVTHPDLLGFEIWEQISVAPSLITISQSNDDGTSSVTVSQLSQAPSNDDAESLLLNGSTAATAGGSCGGSIGSTGNVSKCSPEAKDQMLRGPRRVPSSKASSSITSQDPCTLIIEHGSVIRVNVSGTIYTLEPAVFKRLRLLPWVPISPRNGGKASKNHNAILVKECNLREEKSTSPRDRADLFLRTTPQIFEILYNHAVYGTLPDLRSMCVADMEELEPLVLLLGMKHLEKHLTSHMMIMGNRYHQYHWRTGHQPRRMVNIIPSIRRCVTNTIAPTALSSNTESNTGRDHEADCRDDHETDRHPTQRGGGERDKTFDRDSRKNSPSLAELTTKPSSSQRRLKVTTPSWTWPGHSQKRRPTKTHAECVQESDFIN